MVESFELAKSGEVFASESSTFLVDGHGLCDAVLNETENNAEDLLILAEWQEATWLEFKAAYAPRKNEELDPGTNLHDYQWHVAEAVIALANTHGGCVLLGVDDNGEPIGFYACDPQRRLERFGEDSFKRNLVDSVLLRATGWPCGRAGKIIIGGGVPKDLIEVRIGHLRDEKIVIVLVRRRPDAKVCTQCGQFGESYCISCIENPDGRKREFVPTRSLAGVGKIERQYLLQEWKCWEKARRLDDRYVQLLNRFHRKSAKGARLAGEWSGWYRQKGRKYRFEMTVTDETVGVSGQIKFRGFSRERRTAGLHGNHEFLFADIEGKYDVRTGGLRFVKRYRGGINNELEYVGQRLEAERFEGDWRSKRRFFSNSGSFEVKKENPLENMPQLTVLVTGFATFGRHDVNSSWQVAKEVRGFASELEPHRLFVEQLPVDFEDARRCLEGLLKDFRPHICLCLGMNAASSICRIELEARKPKQFRGEPGRDLLVSSWPVEELMESLAEAGIPVRASSKAGRYVCESTYWTLLDYRERTGYPQNVAFLHVPVTKKLPSGLSRGIVFAINKRIEVDGTDAGKKNVS